MSTQSYLEQLELINEGPSPADWSSSDSSRREHRLVPTRPTVATRARASRAYVDQIES